MTDAIKGRVSGMQQRAEVALRTSWAVWDFRLERTTSDGKPLPRVPVEMRGRRFEGSITNGDVVEIAANWTQGQILHTREVHNATTGVTVKARGLSRGQWIAINAITLLVMALILLVVGFTILDQWRGIHVRPIPPPIVR
jgi:hypothetical protein